MPRRSDEHPPAPVPARAGLASLRRAAPSCRACDLYKHATQLVFGEGKKGTPLLFVGEQPGNDEDLEGRPFVGPSGKLLGSALEEAGIRRQEAYVTNAVKHFKFEARGKRRIHKKPNTTEVAACRPWLLAEIGIVSPRLVVCLGATAAQSLLGSSFRVSVDRGRIFEAGHDVPVMATVHPSSLLRAPDPETRRIELQRFVADLRIAAKFVAREAKG